LNHASHLTPLVQTAVLFLVWLTTTIPLLAQEAVRVSLAGEASAEARRSEASARNYYTLHLGPTAWNLNAGLELDANDNITLEPVDPEGDLIFRPQMSTRMLWPITEKNNIIVALGTGYSAYVEHPEFDRFFIMPGSELSFDVYVRDLWLNLHDRFSITEDSYQDPTAVGVGDYSQLQNDAGVTTTWDLNKVLLKLAFDHINYALLSGSAGPSDGSSEAFSLSAGYDLRPSLRAGLEVGGGFLHYSGTSGPFEEAMDFNAGAFLDAQVSDHVHVRANGGYTIYSPESARSQPVPPDFTGAYGQLLLTHKLNKYLDYTLGGGRTINFAFFGGTVDLSTAQLQANWNLIKGIGLSTTFQYDHGSQIFSGQEVFDRYGPGVNVGRRLTGKLSASFRYQFYLRESSQAGRDYDVNVLTLGLHYQL